MNQHSRFRFHPTIMFVATVARRWIPQHFHRLATVATTKCIHETSTRTQSTDPQFDRNVLHRRGGETEHRHHSYG